MSTTVLAQQAPQRNAYFGETHVHTSWSFDAYVFGNHYGTPADAYKYAKGEPIKHPMGYDIKIETPLDWMGVTGRATASPIPKREPSRRSDRPWTSPTRPTQTRSVRWN